MKNEGVSRTRALIAPIIFGVLCLVYIAQATSLTPLIAPVTIGTNGSYDTVLKSGWQSIDPDSMYKWVTTVRGTAGIVVKVMSQFNGVAGDTLTADSVDVTGGYESYVATINGDSLKDMAWSQWTNYSATARTALKAAHDKFKYQVLVLVLNGTGTPVIGLDRLTN
jgi:hypothetical protein